MNRILERRNALLIVAAAALLVYANSLWNRFAYDDIWIIFDNARVHQLHDLRQIWLTSYWPESGTQLGLYRPLTIFFFAVEWAIGGGAPWLFHAVNVLLHVAVCVVVFLLAEKLFSRAVAFGCALVFAVHPLHTEAVANVVGQAELWAALAVLSACLIYVSRPPGEPIGRARTAVLLVLYALGLLAKEHAVVLPGLLVLLDFVQERVTLTRSGLRRYAAAMAFMLLLFCAVLGAFLLLRIRVLGHIGGTDVAPGLPFLTGPHRVWNAFRAWPEFIRLLFLPLDLSLSYGPAIVLPVDSVTPMVALGILLTAGVLALTLAVPWQRRAGLAAGWFLIAILPASNFFFPIGVLIAERTLYLPSLAVCFLAGFAWEAIEESPLKAKRLGYGLAGVVLIVFSARTFERNKDWKTLRKAWNGLLRDHPESYLSQWVMAVTAAANGQVDLADRYFRIAYRIWPHDSRFLNEMAGFYVERHDYETAIVYLERSRRITPWAPVTYELLADAYLKAGRPGQAIAYARQANSMSTKRPFMTYSTIAAAYDQQGNYDRAVAAWRTAAHAPNGGMWLHYAMGARSLAYDGRIDEALATADTAVSRTAPGSGMRDAALRFKSAIRTGCYQRGSGGLARACDPLQSWALSTGPKLIGSALPAQSGAGN
ncbi:MAG TPA: hypothetical protein VF021_00365 [Longimicrobiales bacterium]